MIVRVMDSRKKRNRCDQCGETKGVLECFLPYSHQGGGVPTGKGRWRDCCNSCREAFLRDPQDYVTVDTSLTDMARLARPGAVIAPCSGGL